MMDETFETLQIMGMLPQEATIYIHTLMPLSMSDLSKILHIPRTTLYRSVKEMLEKGYIKTISQDSKVLYQSIDFEILQSVFKQKVRQFHEKAESVTEKLREMRVATPLSAQPKVTIYHSREQLEIVLWQTLDYPELCGFFSMTLEDLFNHHFVKEYRRELFAKGVKQREILSDNDPYLSWDVLNKIKKSRYFNLTSYRYVAHHQFPINHQMYVFGNDTIFFNFTQSHPYVVQIEDGAYTQLQKQLFEQIWSIAKTPEETLKERENR